MAVCFLYHFYIVTKLVHTIKITAIIIHMSAKVKKAILKIPGLGHAAKVTKRVIALPSDQIAQEKRLESLQKANSQAIEQNAQLIKQYYDSIQIVLDDIQKQLTLLDKYAPQNNKFKTKKSAVGTDLFANDHLLDVFYANFEDRFRGTERMVEDMLSVYMPYFTKSKVNFSKHPVLDIGSGRGEFLKLLKEYKIKGEGLDINTDMVERANKKGLATKQGDVLGFLNDAKSQSYGAITGFHLAEHLPFGLLLRVFKDAHRVLTPGGFLIFETPNPENVNVGSYTFYLDPSHLNPLPPILLEFALETCGFRNIEIKRLHPDEQNQDSKLPPELAERFHGPRDYAVIGYK